MKDRLAQQAQQVIEDINAVLFCEAAPCLLTEELVVAAREDRCYFRLPQELQSWIALNFTPRTSGISIHEYPPGCPSFCPVYGYQQKRFRFPAQVIFWQSESEDDAPTEVICEWDFDGFGAVYGLEQALHMSTWAWQHAPLVLGREKRKTDPFAVLKHLRKRYRKTLQKTKRTIKDVRDA